MVDDVVWPLLIAVQNRADRTDFRDGTGRWDRLSLNSLLEQLVEMPSFWSTSMFHRAGSMAQEQVHKQQRQSKTRGRGIGIGRILSLNLNYECESDARRIDYEYKSNARRIEAPFMEKYSTPSYTPF